MMRSHLNGGLWGSTGKWVHNLGFDGVRYGVRVRDGQDQALRVLEAFQNHRRLTPLFLIAGEHKEVAADELLDFTGWFASQVAQHGFDRTEVAIEFVNEPNIFNDYWKDHPEELGELFVNAIERIRRWAEHVTILSPSVSNLGKNEIVYAWRLFAPIKRQTTDYEIAFHRYPVGHSHEAHDGLENRDEELARFLDAVTNPNESPRLWLTETGIAQHQRRPRSFPFCWSKESYRISEEEQADFCEWEYRYWGTRIAALAWYQFVDGPEPFGRETFGVYQADLTPKVIADRFPSIHANLKNGRS